MTWPSLWRSIFCSAFLAKVDGRRSKIGRSAICTLCRQFSSSCWCNETENVFYEGWGKCRGFCCIQASLMRDSDALLILVEEIIHADSVQWGILLTKQPVQSSVQSRCALHFPSKAINKRVPATETISNRIKRGAACRISHQRQRRQRHSASSTNLSSQPKYSPKLCLRQGSMPDSVSKNWGWSHIEVCTK